MRFDVSALALTVGLFWGGAMFLVGAANLVWPGYGRAFLELAASIYPGYQPTPVIGQVVVGTLYGLVDGAIGGLLFGWIYNLLSRALSTPAA
ncbi:MAG: hypothetical protein HY323_18575 [Betaproteobacteria bacterium]|nr:hypothetical protein [Betaproteobacteria bacterium]